MRAYCAAMAPRLGELMGSASQQELDIRQDANTPDDAAHSTKDDEQQNGDFISNQAGSRA